MVLLTVRGVLLISSLPPEILKSPQLLWVSLFFFALRSVPIARNSSEVADPRGFLNIHVFCFALFVRRLRGRNWFASLPSKGGCLFAFCSSRCIFYPPLRALPGPRPVMTRSRKSPDCSCVLCFLFPLFLAHQLDIGLNFVAMTLAIPSPHICHRASHIMITR